MKICGYDIRILFQLKILLNLIPVFMLFCSFSEKFEIYAQLGAIKDGTATKAELLCDPVLRIFPVKFPNGRSPNIKSFEILISGNEMSFPSAPRSGELTSEQINQIRIMLPGQTIYIERIIMGCMDACDRPLANITIRIIPG